MRPTPNNNKDVNNDGAADIIIGAYQADPVGSMSGEVYVVFGSLSWTESLLNLGELGARGLTFQGAERREYVGHSVAGAGGVYRDGVRLHTSGLCWMLLAGGCWLCRCRSWLRL